MADKLHKWQEEFKLKDELLQGDFEAIEMALLKMPNAATVFKHADFTVVRGSWLRAAIASGWIIAPECKAMTDEKNAVYIYDGVDVDRMHPAKVSWLGKQIVKRHDAVMSEDPKN